MQSIKKFNEINFDLVGACIARPLKTAENKSGRPMVAPTNKTEVLYKIKLDKISKSEENRLGSLLGELSRPCVVTEGFG